MDRQCRRDNANQNTDCIYSWAIRKPPRPRSISTSPYIFFNMFVNCSIATPLSRIPSPRPLLEGGMLTPATAWTRCCRHCRMPGRTGVPMQGKRNRCQSIRRGQAYRRLARLHGVTFTNATIQATTRTVMKLTFQTFPSEVSDCRHLICVRLSTRV